MKGKVAILLSAFCLATIGVFVKLIDGAVPLMTLSFLRLFLSVVFLSMLMPFVDRDVFKFSRKDLKDYILIGGIFALNFSLYVMAMHYTDISNVVIIDTMVPFAVVILSFLFLKEKISRAKITMIIIAAAGMLLINPFRPGGSLLGNVLALCSVITYAVLLTYMRSEGLQHDLGVVFWYFVFGAIFLSPMPFIFGLGQLGSKWIFVLLLALLSTAMAYTFMAYGLKRVEAGTVGIIEGIFTPLIALVFAFSIFSEEIRPMMILGGVILIVSGIYLEVKETRA